jgi:GTPase
MSGLVAIVGRPNVGKSALFNRIAGRRIAIVHDRPGVTRDRVMSRCEWEGRAFDLVDTGGVGLMRGEKSEDVLLEAAARQVDMALEAADVILFVVNVREGLTPLDAEVAKRLRERGRPVHVVANQADEAKWDLVADSEFAKLGFGAVLPASAIHSRGIEAVLTAALQHLPAPDAPAPAPAEGEDEFDETPAKSRREVRREKKPDPTGPLRLAVVGRPNVGKSSIINALTHSERVIVSEIPGTTRDAVDVPFDVDTESGKQTYVLVDTAGLRKARKVDDSVEFFSTERTRDAISHCDIAILVMDAVEGIMEQDKKIADIILENRRACILVVNKWDLVKADVRQARELEVSERLERHRDDRRKRLTTLAEFGDWVRGRLFFLDHAPVIFTSAKDGFQLERLLEAVRFVGAQWRQRVPTAILNRTLQDAVERRQPVSKQGRRLKFYYATQAAVAPPTFVMFVNDPTLFAPAYEKYLGWELRKTFGYEGCPVVLVPRERKRTIEPVRERRVGGGGRGPRSTRKPEPFGAGKKRGPGSRRPTRRGPKPAGGGSGGSSQGVKRGRR